MSINRYVARYWRKLDANKVECILCPRHCILKEGSKGFCSVRKNIDGNLILLTYGKCMGLYVDPMEKKPLYHFYPGKNILSFGSAGCNLACKFCQNWHMSRATDAINSSIKADPESIALAAKEQGCVAVAFTYNDPVIFAEYAIDTAKACRDLGIKTVAVTAGYINETPRREFFSYMDAANVDLKSLSVDFYNRLCSVELQPVLDTLVYLKEETDVWFEITNLVIPNENDSPQDLERLSEWIVDNLGDNVPVHFSAFHPAFKMLEYPPTPPETVKKAREIAISKGIKYVYTGNILDEEGANTYCKSCGRLLISRKWAGEVVLYMENGICPGCGTVCDGFFDVKNSM